MAADARETFGVTESHAEGLSCVPLVIEAHQELTFLVSLKPADALPASGLPTIGGEIKPPGDGEESSACIAVRVTGGLRVRRELPGRCESKPGYIGEALMSAAACGFGKGTSSMGCGLPGSGLTGSSGG